MARADLVGCARVFLVRGVTLTAHYHGVAVLDIDATVPIYRCYDLRSGARFETDDLDGAAVFFASGMIVEAATKVEPAP